MNSYQLITGRPSYSAIVRHTLDQPNLWSLQLFHARRRAHININTYPAAHDRSTHSGATSYLLELSALSTSNAEIGKLATKLRDLDHEQMLFIEDYFKDEDWVLRANELKDAVMRLPVLPRESLTGLKESGRFMEHPVVGALIARFGEDDEEEVKRVFEGFEAEIAEAEDDLRFAREDIWGIEKRALRVWWKIQAVLDNTITPDRSSRR